MIYITNYSLPSLPHSLSLFHTHTKDIYVYSILPKVGLYLYRTY